MSVKSLTVVLDDDGREICVLLRTLDGHLTGHGAELRAYLRGYVIARETKCTDRTKLALSLGMLAVFLINEFTAGIGSFELLPAGTRGIGEAYVYSVYARHNTPTLPSLLKLRVEEVRPAYGNTVNGNGYQTTVIFDDLLDEFDPHATLGRWSHRQDEANAPETGEVATARAATASGDAGSKNTIENNRRII